MQTTMEQIAAMPVNDLHIMFDVGLQLLAGTPEGDIQPDLLGFYSFKTRTIGLAPDTSHSSLTAAAWYLQTIKPQILALNPPPKPKRKRR